MTKNRRRKQDVRAYKARTGMSMPAATRAVSGISPINTMGNLRQRLDESSGIMTISMGELRSVLGHGRIGPRVKIKMIDQMREAGLEVIPNTAERLPDKQNSLVRVYDPSSDIGRIMQAMVVPSKENDQILLSLDFAPVEKLNEIRMLVED